MKKHLRPKTYIRSRKSVAIGRDKKKTKKLNKSMDGLTAMVIQIAKTIDRVIGETVKILGSIFKQQ